MTEISPNSDENGATTQTTPQICFPPHSEMLLRGQVYKCVGCFCSFLGFTFRAKRPKRRFGAQNYPKIIRKQRETPNCFAWLSQVQIFWKVFPVVGKLCCRARSNLARAGTCAPKLWATFGGERPKNTQNFARVSPCLAGQDV